MISSRRLLRLGLIAGILAVAPGASAEPWAYTFEGYGYLPWVNSTTTIRGFETETNLAPGQALNLLQSAFSARASAEQKRLGCWWMWPIPSWVLSNRAPPVGAASLAQPS